MVAARHRHSASPELAALPDDPEETLTRTRAPRGGPRAGVPDSYGLRANRIGVQ